MYVLIAFGLVVLVAWYAKRENQKERANLAVLTDDEVRTAVLHSRQDLKLIALLLGAILVMLGTIAQLIAGNS